MPRIIAGRYGGRRLRAPDGRGTRPTSDRVREALFARLEYLGALDGVVLDLFAGSGALGLEAVSRGAERVVLVDADRRAVAACRANLELADGAARVQHRSVAAFLQGSPEPFDLVLLDPPYDLAEPHLGDVLAALTRGWLAPRAVVVVERSARSPQPVWPAGLVPLDHRSYGETALWFAEPGESDLPGPDGPTSEH